MRGGFNNREFPHARVSVPRASAHLRIACDPSSAFDLWPSCPRTGVHPMAREPDAGIRLLQQPRADRSIPWDGTRPWHRKEERRAPALGFACRVSVEYPGCGGRDVGAHPTHVPASVGTLVGRRTRPESRCEWDLRGVDSRRQRSHGLPLVLGGGGIVRVGWCFGRSLLRSCGP